MIHIQCITRSHIMIHIQCITRSHIMIHIQHIYLLLLPYTWKVFTHWILDTVNSPSELHLNLPGPASAVRTSTAKSAARR
jgi:hypothetical protein